jgi:hypothetical protein
MGLMSKRLILLTYQNRSGSTLLLNLFSRDKRIVTCLEAEILIDLLLAFPNKELGTDSGYLFEKLTRNAKLSQWNLSPTLFSEGLKFKNRFDLFLHIINSYSDTINPNSEIICFKGTNVANHFEEIENICEAKGIKCDLIRIIRDPRAVWASQKRTVSPTTGKTMSSNPLDVARSWNDWVALTSCYEGIKTIFYEKLIADGEKEFTLLCNQLNIDFKNIYPSGTLYQRLPNDYRSIHRNIEKPFLLHKADAWKSEISSFSVAVIEREGRTNLKLMGYEPTRSGRTNLLYLTMEFLLRIISRVKFIKNNCRKSFGYNG